MVSDVRMLPFLVVIATAYLLANTAKMLYIGKPVYPTHDWHNSPAMAVFYSSVLYTFAIGFFMIFYRFNKIKLRRHLAKVKAEHDEQKYITENIVMTCKSEGDAV